MKIPLLIDTDPGIDDALALLLALRSPECSVEAITTVAGNVAVERCTLNVFRVLEAVSPGRPPVVGQGAGAPLRRPLTTASHVHGDDGLGDLAELRDPDGRLRYPPPRLTLSPLDGPELILDTIGRFPEELVLVALGPLTNLARALERDPRRVGRVRRVVVMGGAVAVPGNVTPVAEFNFYVDPEAAARVLEAGLPIELVPLDVTRRTVLSRPVLERRLGGHQDSPPRFIADLTAKGFRLAEELGDRGLILHDPLALAVALEPSLVTFEPLHVAVECAGDLTRGMAVADRRRLPPEKKRAPNCRVALSVDAERFLQFFLDRLCPASS